MIYLFLYVADLYIPLSSDKTVAQSNRKIREEILYIPLSSDKTVAQSNRKIREEILYIPLSSDKTHYIFYHYNCNYILYIPLSSDKTSKELIMIELIVNFISHLVQIKRVSCSF